MGDALHAHRATTTINRQRNANKWAVFAMDMINKMENVRIVMGVTNFKMESAYPK